MTKTKLIDKVITLIQKAESDKDIAKLSAEYSKLEALIAKE